jgi:hypothetical protein
VHDPALAARVIELALGKQLPPQANYLPEQLVFNVADHHQRLAWQAYVGHSDQLLAYNPMFAMMTIAQTSPLIFWSGIPLGEIEAFMRAKVPAGMGPEVKRGLESAKVRLRRREILVHEIDAYLRRQAA